MKKIIMINGLIASGKNTIGELLVKHFNENGTTAEFYDIDKAVEEINPTNTWGNEEDTLKVWLQARKNYAEKANNSESEVIVVVGPFFSKAEIKGYIDYIDKEIPLYLFMLDTPVDIRIERNKHRSRSNDPKDITDQEASYQKIKDSLYGGMVKNDGPMEETIKQITEQIDADQGKLNRDDFKE
jgi:thymidylate kinase